MWDQALSINFSLFGILPQHDMIIEYSSSVGCALSTYNSGLPAEAH
jgi:hypothetical protein